jgi:hypothetical protein
VGSGHPIDPHTSSPNCFKSSANLISRNRSKGCSSRSARPGPGQRPEISLARRDRACLCWAGREHLPIGRQAYSHAEVIQQPPLAFLLSSRHPGSRK